MSSEFNPYSDNGGTCVSIAGTNFVVIASDKRHSDGYIINTREANRLYTINDQCVLGTTSFHPDGLRLAKDLKILALKYEIKTKKKLNVLSLSQMLSNKLYSRRFFPLYSFNLLCGYDKESNSGYLYSYDPVGSFERENFRSSGCASSIIQPFLDSQSIMIKSCNESSTAVNIIKDSFIAAAERDIHTGDFLDIFIIDKNGIKSEKFDLRKD